uniref:Uncharacterized protein n=1 Tax=Trichobilharzia regenti TaxID=157069 RepID=A0AA85IY72_TRIRE|nr:unnamed protein product [Trichobilharzia regenti]
MNTSNELKATLETLKNLKYFYPPSQINIPPTSTLKNVNDTLTDLFYANLMHLLHNNSQSSVTPHPEDHLTSYEHTRRSDQSTHLSCGHNDCDGNDEKSRSDSSNQTLSQEHSHPRVMNVSFNVANLIDHQNHHDATCDNDDGNDNDVDGEDEKSTSEGKITDDNHREYDSLNRQSVPSQKYSTTPNHQLLDMEDELMLSVSNNNSSASSNTESPLDYSLIK